MGTFPTGFGIAIGFMSESLLCLRRTSGSTNFAPVADVSPPTNPSPVPVLVPPSRSVDFERVFVIRRGATEGSAPPGFSTAAAVVPPAPATLENPYADCARMRRVDIGDGDVDSADL